MRTRSGWPSSGTSGPASTAPSVTRLCAASRRSPSPAASSSADRVPSISAQAATWASESVIVRPGGRRRADPRTLAAGLRRNGSRDRSRSSAAYRPSIAWTTLTSTQTVPARRVSGEPSSTGTASPVPSTAQDTGPKNPIVSFFAQYRCA